MIMPINAEFPIMEVEAPNEVILFMAGRASELDGKNSELTGLLATANEENDNLRIELEDTCDKLIAARVFTETVMFKKAERKQSKLRLALSGPSGSGKTAGALLIAKGIGGKIAALDTERGSASLYSDPADFDVVELGPPYSPERFIEVVKGAEEEGNAHFRQRNP